jgi:hypothetical protein
MCFLSSVVSMFATRGWHTSCFPTKAFTSSSCSINKIFFNQGVLNLEILDLRITEIRLMQCCVSGKIIPDPEQINLNYSEN